MEALLIKLAAALIPIAVSYGTVLLRKYINAKVKDQTVRSVLNEITDVTSVVVRDQLQTSVDEIKARTGGLDRTAQKRLKSTAIYRVRRTLGKRLDELRSHTAMSESQMDDLLGAAVESAVRDEKSFSPVKVGSK